MRSSGLGQRARAIFGMSKERFPALMIVWNAL